MKNMILRIITSHKGIFATELMLIMQADAHPRELNIAEYLRTLKELIEEGNIVEVPYIGHSVGGSVYFPQGTTILGVNPITSLKQTF